MPMKTKLVTICDHSMKYLIIILFFSCSKATLDNNKQPEVCDFGTEYSTEKRPFNPDIIARVRNWQAEKKWDLQKANNVLLLDFDGHHVSGTSWNYNGDFTCSYSGLSVSEIRVVVDSMTTDFAPFNVIVTTDENLYNLADKKTRVVFTESYEWYGKAGGVAYTGSMKWNDNTPCFVFTSLLGYHIGNIRQAASHEAGHTIGLRHQALWEDGVMVSSYNTGINGIAPIMGAPYGKHGMWWVGLNPYGNIQDDKLIINQTLK